MLPPKTSGTIHRRTSRAVFAAIVAALTGCGVPPAKEVDNSNDHNSTDSSNRNARYVGSAACAACHTEIASWHAVHGHARMLTAVLGGPPDFSDVPPDARVPAPPDGLGWEDISYVIGGYRRIARFVDSDGFVLTNADEGVDAQWNLGHPPTASQPGFVAYDPGGESPKPYDPACFNCHTTGPAPLDPDMPQYQEGRPGIAGTWFEDGVQCEQCHGPGGNHFTAVEFEPSIDTSAIYINNNADRCGQCHTDDTDPTTITAAGGFITNYQQWPELLASGGHASFDCTVCHNPHASTTYDPENAIRNDCSVCHPDRNMALHDDAVYRLGDYEERVTCASCHMPLASRFEYSALIEMIDDRDRPQGDFGRIGDTRSHLFRINTANVDYTAMFSEDGASVATDAQGRAAATVDFVCLRCHHGTGNVFGLTVDRASEIAPNVHWDVNGS